MASFQNEEWTVRSLLSTGSHGFFSDIAVYGTSVVVAMEEQLDDRGINQPYLWLLPSSLSRAYVKMPVASTRNSKSPHTDLNHKHLR